MSSFDAESLLQVFGDEPDMRWCHNFQIADLSSKTGDWQKIVNLAGEVDPHEFQSDGFKTMVFVRGYAHTHNWGKASEWVKTINPVRDGEIPAYCKIINDLREQTPDGFGKDDSINEMEHHLKCN
jgi:hypothetical protein